MRSCAPDHVVKQNRVHGYYPACTMQPKHDTGTLGQLKNFIWQSLQLKGKHSETSSHKDDKRSPNKLSPERILRCQNNYANMPTATSLRIKEWQKSQNAADKSLAGNSDYVKMESPKRPHVPHSTGLNKDCDYVNFNCETPTRRSPDYVNMDGTFSDLRTSADYVNLRPEDPHEPRPLTRMNVTLHDQIWSQEDPRGATRTPQTENTLLSPPLKHINPNQFWHHPDPLGISDSVSDKSGSSGDTMIMMTTAEAKRNEANIERSTQKYEHHKGKVSDSGSSHSKELNCGDELDRTCDRDNVVSGANSADELDIDSVLDEGYGTDSRGSTTNSMSTPLSSSLSSLYSGDADPVSRQPHPKLTASAMKRQIELIPKGRIANFRKVQFTTRRTKKIPENSNDSNSLQQKLMDLAIIDEETENESLTVSSGSEKNLKPVKTEDGGVPKPLMGRTHHRSKAERTVRWLDEENAKKPSPSSTGVELRLKSALKQNNPRPKSYSGESAPPVAVKARVPVIDFASPPENRSVKSLEDSKKFSSQCNLRTYSSATHSTSDLPRAGILRNVSADATLKFQRHSVAAPLDSLSSSRTMWRSEVDISRPSRNLEFCSSSQIYDRMRAMTRPQGDRTNADTHGDKSSISDKSDPGIQGRPVFATSADILKIFQSKSKTDSFVRSQRHSFNTLHQKTELQLREFPKESYNPPVDHERNPSTHFRSASDIPRRCVSDNSHSGILKKSKISPVSNDTKCSSKKYSVCSPPLNGAPPRTKLSPPPGGQPLSLSKLSTLV